MSRFTLLQQCYTFLVVWGLVLTCWWIVTWMIVRRIFVLLKVNLSKSGRFGIRDCLRSESGTSYVLPLVMTIPIYLFFCMFVGEVTLLASTKIGVTYAAHAGSRSAAVWDSQRPSNRDERMRQSVVNALAPFVASGNEIGSQAGKPTWPIDQDLAEYIATLESFSQSQIDESRMSIHYTRVAARTSIDLEIPNRQNRADVKVTVTYRAPFLFAFVSRWLDPDGRYPFEIPVTSVATLTLERPVSDAGTLGIDYVSF